MSFIFVHSLIVHIGHELIPEHLTCWPLSLKSCQIIDNSVADSVFARRPGQACHSLVTDSRKKGPGLQNIKKRGKLGLGDLAEADGLCHESLLRSTAS